MLKHFALTLVIGTALIGVASAQQAPTAPMVPANPPAAITAPNAAPTVGAPVPGANSFTEAQAKARLETQGYTNVNGLLKDKDGIWRGMGTKGGRSTSVSLDFQGNVVEK